MDQKHLLLLIDRYLEGKSSPEEIIIVEEWYSSQQRTNKKIYDGNDQAIDESAIRSLTALRKKLGIKDEQTAKIFKIRNFTLPQKWLAAASILVLVSVGWLFYIKNTKTQLAYTVVKTGTGQTKQIKLPDGTLVYLNAGTTLKFPNTFNDINRKVDLKGEAFFDVVHDPKRPFSVYAGNLQTHVLGTAFSVSAYPNSSINAVSVARGKVQVSNKNHMLAYVLPNQELEYQTDKDKSTIMPVQLEDIAAWKNGKLAFIDMPYQDIAIRLQSWYGVKFVFKNPGTKKTRFTASFNNQIPINDLLEVMFDVSHVNYRYDSNTKTITFLQ